MCFKCYERFRWFLEVIEDLMLVIWLGVLVVGDFVVCGNLYLFDENYNGVCKDFFVVMEM